jgi:hypothetical protein
VNPCRASYWKTTLASLGAFLFVIVLALYWLVAGEIRLPALEWSLTRVAFFYWPLMVLIVVFALFCLLIGVGGFVCLHEDSRENKCG